VHALRRKKVHEEVLLPWTREDWRVDAVHVGPNDKLVGIDHVRNQRAGKIRTVPAERGDTAIASRADESGYDRNEAIIEERKKNLAPATARFVNLRRASRNVSQVKTNSEELTGTAGTPVFSRAEAKRRALNRSP